MKKILLFIMFGVVSADHAQTPGWGWAKAITGGASQEPRAIAVDNAGNVYVTGKFSGTTTLFSSITLTNSGAANTSDFFLAKYDQLGNVVWAKRAQGNDNDEGRSVTTDAAGNIYVTGTFESTSITFGATTLTNSSTFGEIFVVKYNPAGNVLWANAYGGNQQESGDCIRADNAGNTYLTGSFQSLSVLFGNSGVINSGTSDAFLTKIDVNGNPLWSKQIGGTQFETGNAVTVDGSGNVYVSGDYNSAPLSSYNLSNGGGFDIFLAKYGATGNLLWSKGIGGTGNELVNALSVDGSGDIYLAGSFSTPVLNLGAMTISNQSARDMLLVRYNPSGTAQWAKRVGGNTSSHPTDLFVDQSTGVYMSGLFDLPSVNFGANSLSNQASSGLEGFVTKYNTSGTDLWSRSVGAPADQSVWGVAADNTGNVFVTGVYNTSLTLGGEVLTGGSGVEGFVAKLCAVPSQPTVVSNVTVCAKATGTLQVLTPPGTSAAWYNAASGGSPLITGSNSFTAANTGTFYAQSTGTNGCSNPSRVPVSLFVRPGVSVTMTGSVLTANTPGATYKWIECNKDSVLNVTTQSYSVTKTGYYAVISNANGCTDTSACKFYSVNVATGTVTTPVDTNETGDPTEILLNAQAKPAVFEVHPNPSDEEFFVTGSGAATIIIYDVSGVVIKTMRQTVETNWRVQVDGIPPGIYFISNGRRTKRVIVN